MMNNPKRLQELCIIPAAFTVLLKAESAILKVLRTCLSGAIITRDKFDPPFVEALHQLDRKRKPSFSEQASGTIFEKKLSNLAWWFITSKDNLFGIIITKVLPTWNSHTKTDKIQVSTIYKLFRIFLSHVVSKDMSESCQKFLQHQKKLKPLELVIIASLLINTDSILAAENVGIYEVIQNAMCNYSDKLAMAAICNSCTVLQWMWDNGNPEDQAAFKEISSGLAMHLQNKCQDSYRWLLNNASVDVNFKSTSGDTLLHAAAISGNLENIVDLIARGAEVNGTNTDGKSPLHKAAEKGYKEILTFLLDNGAIIEMQNSSGNTPLHRACQVGNVESTSLLLASGANIDSVNNKGRSAIHIATKAGHLEIVKLLININKELVIVKTSNDLGNLPSHFASITGRIDIAEFLVSQGAEINAKNNDGETMIHYAAMNGHEKFVEWLMMKEECNVLAMDNKNRNALHEAAWNGHHSILELLLAKLTELDLINAQDYKGCTALHLAAANSKASSCVKLLLDHHADITLNDSNQNTAFEKAIIDNPKKWPIETLEMFMEKGASLGKVYENNQTLLHMALNNYGYCKIDFIKKLLMHESVDVNAKDVNGKTPLHIAIGINEEVVKTLLSCKKIQDVNVKMNCGNTPLHLSAKGGFVRITKVLLERPDIKLKEKNEENEIPLHLAVQNGHFKVTSLLVEESKKTAKGFLRTTTASGDNIVHLATRNENKTGILDKILTLIQDNGIILAKNNASETALDIAVKMNDCHIFELLIDAKDFKCPTVLHIASANGFCEMAELILRKDRNAKIDFIRREDGKTPLHLAVEKGHGTCVSFLLSKGASPDIATTDGDSVLHLAVKSGMPEMVKLLLENENICKNTRNAQRETPLLLSIKLQQYDIIDLLLNDISTDVNELFDNGNTLLHLLVESNIANCIPLLLSKQIDANRENCDGETALHLAIRLGYMEPFMCILNYPEIDINKPNWSLETPLHLTIKIDQNNAAEMLLSKDGIAINARNSDEDMPLHLSIKTRNDNLVEMITVNQNADIGAKDKNGCTPLHLVIEHDFPENLIAIILANSPDINAKDFRGNTVLHLLANKEQFDHVLNLVLQHQKVDFNIRNACGETALHVATKHEMQITFELLLKVVNVDVKCINGKNALHIAIEKRNFQFIKALWKNGADINAPNMQHDTALHLSIKKKFYELTTFLLEQPNINVNAQNNRGDTPLHLVAKKNLLHITFKLLRLNADTHITNNINQIPLHIAAENGNDQIIELFLQVPNAAAYVNSKDNKGNTPLLLIASTTSLTGLQLLVNSGANINAQNNDGECPLHNSINKSNVEISSYLLSLPDINLNCTTNKGDTLLHVAANIDQLDVVEMLIRHESIDALAQNVKKETALHIAAKNGNLEMAKIFGNFPNALNVETDYGYTPLSYAVQNNHWDIARLLAQNGASVNVDINGLGQTPLHKAILKNNSNAVGFLLQYGANMFSFDINDATPWDYSEFKDTNPEIKRIMLAHKPCIVFPNS